MRLKYSISLILFAAILFSQTDTSKFINKLGCSVSLINFIDYSSLKESPFEKTAYYQGFDVNVFFRSPINHTQLELGVLGGDTYPLFDNLNYYFSGVFFLNTKNKKYSFDINPKLMYAYSTKPDGFNRSIIHKNFSFQLGLNAFKKTYRFEFGIGYYVWYSDYKVIIKSTNYDPLNGGPLYQKKGYVPIGILKLTTRFIFGK